MSVRWVTESGARGQLAVILSHVSKTAKPSDKPGEGRGVPGDLEGGWWDFESELTARDQKPPEGGVFLRPG